MGIQEQAVLEHAQAYHPFNEIRQCHWEFKNRQALDMSGHANLSMKCDKDLKTIQITWNHYNINEVDPRARCYPGYSRRHVDAIYRLHKNRETRQSFKDSTTGQDQQASKQESKKAREQASKRVRKQASKWMLFSKLLHISLFSRRCLFYKSTHSCLQVYSLFIYSNSMVFIVNLASLAFRVYF